MSDTTLTKTIYLPTTPEVVWSYLTEKEKLAQWFHPSNATLVEGKDYELLERQSDGSTQKVCWGTVVSMNKPHRMEWTFTVKPLNGAMSSVVWTLEPSAGGTRLTLTHEGIGDAAGDAALGLLLALDSGWDQHFATLRTQINEQTGAKAHECA
ncbi:MAG: SRPBCC domain-containing protein [Granulosicoccus sp.]|nr:SRPBCC domain-containing protein [Granulosicoccus sp.]